MPQKAFTLLETLVSVAIISALAVGIVMFVGSAVTASRTNADKQTLQVLNDALTRYKCGGGDMNALTAGAPIKNVIAKLGSTINWNGLKHIVLQRGKTYLGRSIDSKGIGSQYRFTRYNTYTAETGGMSPSGGLPLFWASDVYSGQAIYTYDGINWSHSPQTGRSVEVGIYRVVSDGTKYIAMISDYTMASSTDGVIWTSTSGPYGCMSMGNAIYANGYFMIMDPCGGIHMSQDGLSWTFKDTPPGFSGTNLAYGGGKYVILSEGFENYNQIYYSTDATSWSDTTMPSSALWNLAVYGNGKFVAIASGSNKAAYSTDGVSWTATTLPVSSYWGRIIHDGSKFVAISTTKEVYSTDGINWTSVDLPSGSSAWCSIGYSSGKYVILPSGGSSEELAAYSTDGINWTTTQLPISGGWEFIIPR